MTSEGIAIAQREEHRAQEQDTSLLRLANVLLEARGAIVIGAVAAALLTATVVFVLPRTFTANSTFVPSTRRSLNLSGAAAGLASTLGLGLPAGEPSESPAFYVELLKSRQLLSAAVDADYDARAPKVGAPQPLADWLKAEGKSPQLRREDAIRRLSDRVTATAEPRLGVVRLSVRSESPELSQELVAFLVQEVDRFNSERRQTQAATERAFIERRLNDVRQQVRSAEDELQQFLVRNRDFRNAADLVLQQERLAQNVQLYRQLYTSLAQSYEQARIDAVRDTPLITVIEPATVPLLPDRRGLVAKCLSALVLGGGLAVIIAFLRAGLSGGTDSVDAVEFRRLRAQSWEDIRHPIRSLRRALLGRAAISPHE